MDGNFNKAKGFTSLLLLFFIATSAFQCDPEKDPEFVQLIFIIPLSISPPSDEFQLKDTVWVKGDFPDTLLEYYSGKYYKLSNFDFKTRLGISKLISSNLYFGEQPGSLESFEIFNKVGKLDNLRDTFSDLHFNYSNNNYHCKIGLIPNATGIYNISFLWPINLHGTENEKIDLRPYINLGEGADGRKLVPLYDAFLYVVNDGLTNFDLLTQNSKVVSVENPESFKEVYYEQKGSFTFRVVE